MARISKEKSVKLLNKDLSRPRKMRAHILNDCRAVAKAYFAWSAFVVPLVLCLSVFRADVHGAEKIFRAVVDGDGIQRVDITGGEYYFDPDHIIVTVNAPVTLTFRKTPGITPHDIIIKAPEAGIDINENMGRKPATVTFTPTKTGRFEIYCSKRFLFFKNHKDRGMKGVLEVVE